MTCGGPPGPVVSPDTSGPGVALTVAVGVGTATTGAMVEPALGTAPGVGEPVGDAVGVLVGDALGVSEGVGDGDAAGAVMLVVMVARHVTVLPPGLPVPLHWLTRIAMAGATFDVPTAQSTVPPPPFAEPLHWVTVAPDVVAGNGEQLTVPPPPPPEPTHWFTVAAVTGDAPGVSELMLFVTVTVQVIGCAASLSELLHCVTSVTRSTELLENVPLPDGQGSSEH